ncbi:MAG: rod shape-determining protein MreC [Gemmatimonadales bacterium]|nr:MAG: rod shape-determining protein MreC [Gemmatimonadales bacterium]
MVRRRSTIIALILLVTAVLLNLPAPASRRIKESTHANLAPFQNLMSVLIHRSRHTARLFVEMREADDRIQDLEAENATLKLHLRRVQLDCRETDALREQLAFRQRQKWNMVMAEVIGRGEVSGWWQAVRVNRGRESGLRPDMAVVTADGLVGKTTAVAQGTSDVLLITDPNCRVACRVPRTGGFGIVQGTGITPDGAGRLDMQCAAGLSRLDFVARDEPLREGYEIVTAGLGGVYPAGILVGHVHRTGVEPTGLYQQADLLPAARLDTLRFVFVITDSVGEGGE